MAEKRPDVGPTTTARLTVDLWQVDWRTVADIFRALGYVVTDGDQIVAHNLGEPMPLVDITLHRCRVNPATIDHTLRRPVLSLELDSHQVITVEASD